MLARFENSLRAFSVLSSPFSVLRFPFLRLPLKDRPRKDRQVQQYQDVETWESGYPFRRRTSSSVHPCGERAVDFHGIAVDVGLEDGGIVDLVGARRCGIEVEHNQISSAPC